MSEEFLRQYESGEEFTQTIDEAVGEGESLFGGEYKSKSSAKQEMRSNRAGRSSGSGEVSGE